MGTASTHDFLIKKRCTKKGHFASQILDSVYLSFKNM